jgi:tetratricopeptide (TPR) repeat protein
MRHGRFLLALLLAVPCCWLVSLAQPPKKAPAPPATKEDEEPSAEEAKEKAIADRFQKVLETNPRRGTALDRLYGYHVERGTLDKLIGSYVERTKANAKDGNAWMIVGLLESQRGKDAAAVAAFRKAEEHLPANPMAGYYLGQSLVLIGQPDAAAEAFERAIARKPNRTDQLDFFQALGRVYQRAQRTEKALDVWSRLEKLYPDDARVQEQIATTLVEEGQYDQALPRLEKLAAATDDKYRQSTYRIEAAELKVKLKKTAEALADFEKLLAELNPESWLHRDVRRRVEDVFLRGDDLAGLAKYYEKWLEKHPTDIDVFARLAKNLSSQGRAPEAKAWLEKGLAAAPTNRALRQGLIDQLVFEQNFAEAAKQYEELDKNDPGNPDTIRDWGRLLMRDPSKPEAERRTAAAAIWKRLLEKKPNDPVTTAQVADLLRSASATDDAIALYKKAIDLAPDAAQYREYLGEYYHSLKRSDEALATWRPIAEGKNRSSKNLARLAEVFAGFGYRKEAIAAMADAISLEKDDFGLLMTYAQLLNEDGQHDLALQQIAAASKRTSNPEEVEQILIAEIKVYQATEKLVDQIAALEKEIGADAPADRWLRLARFYEANRQLEKASESIGKAAAKDLKSIPVLVAAARIYESAGDMLAAADTNRKLAAVDRRYRSEYLQAVAKLEQRLGRRELALQAGRDVLAASPGNPEVYKFYADLCFQLGEQEEGLEALRRSVRANPSDPAGLMTLAGALAERTRQGEAIELLWRAFEKTNELEAKLGVIDRITQLYLENNQFDRLIERLERERRESDKAREMAMCIAQAFTTAGDLGTARAQLEKLLTENNRDVHLLTQLVTLCETEGDVAAAVKFQRLINAAAPNNYDHQLKLAQLLTRTGESEEAADIWVKLVAGETEPHRNLAAIDQLLSAKKEDAALAILSRMLAQKPGNWELLFREGATLFAKNKLDEAATRFNAIMALKVPDDEQSEITKNQIKQAKKKAAAAPRPGQPPVFNPYARNDDLDRPGFLRRIGNVYRIREATGSEARYYGRGYTPPYYYPSDFGEARLACLAYLVEVAKSKGTSDALVKRFRDAKDKAGADPRPVWDWLYFQTLRNDYKDRVATAFALSKGADPAGLLAYLNTVTSRTYGQSGRRYRQGSEVKDNTPPLPPDQLAQVMACYQKLKQVKPDWVTADVTQTVMTELKRAKKEDEETAIYKGLLAGATTVEKVQAVLELAANRKDVDTTIELYMKLDKLQGQAKTAAALPQLPTRQANSQLEYLVANLADDKRPTDALKVFDLALSTARRQNLSVPPSTVRRVSQGGGFGGYIPGKVGKNYNVSFPSPGEYYDFQLLHLMYTTFAKFREADLLSDLHAHVRKQAEAAQGAERMYLTLVLGYMHWWNEEKDESIAQLVQAMALVPADHNLVMDVSALREQNGENDAALALLDSIAPLDTQMMQRREESAMRLAERTGNIDRARQAAERLFGLRLDADKQLELAGKMHRLGMAELAETVLNRAQRQAGNKTGTLLRLMNQYQSQNQTDLAVQIARQILRKGPAMNVNPRGGYDENDGARNQAIGVLARSGQLKEMIERAEAQLKTSPKSIPMHQALVGYYQAAGEKEKLKGILKAMADLKPEDGKLRFQVAQQLMQSNEREAALEEYKKALKLDPSSFGNRYWEIQNLFAQLNKYEELAQLMDEIDLRKIGNYWSVFEIISSLLQNDKGKDMGLKLFKKAWDAFPQSRGQLLSQLYDENIWRLPEIYAYAKGAVIPREDSDFEPWEAATQILSYGSEGRADGVITRLLSIARKQQRLPELKEEVRAALEKRPDWIGGKAILAILEIQTGNKEAGKKLWQETFADPKSDVPAVARFILCQELEFYSGVEDVAVQTLEGGIEELMKDGNYEYSYSPARRLVWWYEHLGRDADAKKLKMRFVTTEQADPGYGGGYWQYRTVQNKLSIAQELQRTGDTIEAVKLFNQLLADKDTLGQANRYFGGEEQFTQQVEMGLRTALKSLKPATLPAAVGTLLTPREGTPADKSVLDLVVFFESRDLAKSTFNCVFATAIKSAETSPEVRRDAMAKLAELAKKHPNDFSVHTAAALAALADGKPEGTRAAIDRLVKLIESTPLEPLPANGRANARQRADAQPQVLLWLVARECLGKEKDREPYRAAGEKIAERAVAAAKRQQDQFFVIAMLREWGQLDLDRGDKAKAEARFTEILELALPKPNPAKAVGAAPAPVPAPPAVPAAPAPPPVPVAPPPEEERADNAGPGAIFLRQQPPVGFPAPKKAAPAPTRAGAPVLTTDQFQQAYEVAVLAAEKELPALSLRAIRDAVKGGPPVPAQKDRNMRGGPLQMRMIGGQQYYVEGGAQIVITVEQALADLVPKWRALKVPPADIYEVVVGAVLPAARPAEVFLTSDGRIYGTIYSISPQGYLTPVTGVIDDAGLDDRGLAALLSEVAVEAGKVDDLRARAKTRMGQPLGELPAQVLLATLAMRAKDEAGAIEVFKAFGARIQKDSSPGTNERAISALLPAFADPKYADVVAPFIEKAADNFALGNNTQKAVELRFKLADRHLAAKNEAGARAQFKAVEAMAKKGTGRGEYNVHLPLAGAYLKAGWTEEAMREFGLHADEISSAGADPRFRSRRNEPTLGEFPRLVRLLLEMPADKRYETLKAWSMPTAGRKSIRYYVGTMPDHVPPPEVAKLPAKLPAGQIVTTMLLLADAAKEAGKSDELEAAAQKMVAEKIENADVFLVLLKLSAGKGKEAEAAVKAYAEVARKRMTEKIEQGFNPRYYDPEFDGRQQIPLHPTELLFATMCLADPAVAAHGEGLLKHLLDRAQGSHQIEHIARIRAATDRLGVTRSGAPEALTGGLPPRWHSATPGAVWFAQEGYLVQARNEQPSLLLYDAPLAGTFEFSVDVYQGGWTEGHAGYAGVVYEPNRNGVGSSVWAIGHHDQVHKAAQDIRANDFNRLTFQVSPGKVRCLLNGQLFYEDTDAPATSPWLMLYASGGRRPVFRNPTISGKPEVPAEVKLSGADHLGGWHVTPYGGSMFNRMFYREQADGGAQDQWGNKMPRNNNLKDAKYDWHAKDGEIHGRKMDRAPEKPVPARLAYFRPLRPGEALRYEFFYEPGKSHVYPSIGSIAYLIEPEGVKLHWLGTSDDWTGLPADNAIADPAAKGAKPALKSGDWNALVLTTTATGVKIELNGALVYEGKLHGELDRQFGLFHYSDKTAARVRNVVLTGPWSKEVPAAITFSTEPANGAQAKARRQQLGERYYSTEARDVVERARKLPPAERYKLLAEWVLPNDSRPSFQLAGTEQPLDVLGSVDKPEQPAGRRVMLGSRFEAPCLELVAAAKAAGALDELGERIAKAEGDGDQRFIRSKAAMLAAVRAAQGRDNDAATALKQLIELIKKLPPDANPDDRWPDLVAVLSTLERPALLKPVNDLAQEMNLNLQQSNLQNRPFDNRDWWTRAYRSARARAIVAALPEGVTRPFASDPGLAHWASVPSLNSWSRSQGWGAPHWSYQAGVVTHFPGHSEDFLLFRTPLRGDFEVTCDLRVQGWAEAHVRYGTHQFDLNHDRKKYKVHSAIRPNGRDVTINPPLAASKTTVYQFKMVVKNGTFYAFVDGRELASEKIGENPEPWLMLHCHHQNTGTLTNVQINGKPTIPEKIDLLANDDLGLWQPHLGNVAGGRNYGGEGPGWSKRGEELFEYGKQPDPPEEGKPVPPRYFPESALYYQRPMIEDGAIEYEFYYNPGKSHVHPMLDRLTFLLEPDGVKLHWLTDGPHEKSGLAFDNAKDEAACRRGPAKLPLNEKAWNKVRLAVVGDKVKVSLNGTEVYERPIEATNQRFFGLFHYSDRTEVRVRSMTFAGDWGKTLPTNEKLFEKK